MVIFVFADGSNQQIEYRPNGEIISDFSFKSDHDIILFKDDSE